MPWPAPVLRALDIVVNHPLTPQIAPIFILFGLPLLAFLATGPIAASVSSALHMFSSLWTWASGSSSRDGREKYSKEKGESKKLRKKDIRSRSGQIANGHANGHASGSSEKSRQTVTSGHFPGLVNISGTYCFMDSTLQALASLSYLPDYLDSIQAGAEVFDVATPATDALRHLLLELNTPRTQKMALRPHGIINALSHAEQNRRQTLMHSRQHQDAQELFQLLSEQLKIEAAAVMKETRRDRGFNVSHLQPPADEDRALSRSVFDGLTANRRACMQCGYTEAVMHFGFDNWQLALPNAQGCTLEDCLVEYTKLELLTDCMCRRCSMRATHATLSRDAARLTASAEAETNPTSSKKRRARDARKYESRVRAMLEEGRIEDDLGGIPLERVVAPATKQAMIGRPPPVLALHLNRSMHYGAYAQKNRAPVAFPPILDLTPFTTSGQLSTQPRLPMSASSVSSPTPFFMKSLPTAEPANAAPRILYSLAAVVCHYGDHSYGHYVSYRRIPSSPPSPSPPTSAFEMLNTDWLRASDDDVRRVPLAAVLHEQSAAFMLFYELVPPPQGVPREMSIVSGPGAWPARPDSLSSRESIETVRPRRGTITEADRGSLRTNGSATNSTSNGSANYSSSSGSMNGNGSMDMDPHISMVDTTAATGARTSTRPGSGMSTSMMSNYDASMFGTGVATGARTTMVSHTASSLPFGASASAAAPTEATAGSRATSPQPSRSQHPLNGSSPGSPYPDSRRSSPAPRLVRSVTAHRHMGMSNAAINAGALLPPKPFVPFKGPPPPMVTAPMQRPTSPVPSIQMRRRPERVALP